MKKLLLTFIFSTSIFAQAKDSSVISFEKKRDKINSDETLSLEEKKIELKVIEKELERTLIKKAFEESEKREAFLNNFTPLEKETLKNKPLPYEKMKKEGANIETIKDKLLDVSIEKVSDSSGSDDLKYNKLQMKEQLKEKFLTVATLDTLDKLYKEERQWMKAQEYYQFFSALPVLYQDAYQRILKEMSKQPQKNEEKIEN